MRSRSRTTPAKAVVTALVLVLTSCGASPTAARHDADLAILFIGNSLTYSNDLPEMLRRLLVEGGAGEVAVASVAYANHGLPDHWDRGDARQAIAEGGWDFVILQQGPSATEGRPYLLEYSELFATEIRGGGAQPALYMVWPAQSRSFDFDGVSDSYATAAELVDGLLLPAGDAWRAAWRIDPDVALYGPDGFHPSLAGSYLAALVMYGRIFDQDPRDLTADAGDPGLPEPLVRLLQEAAAQAIDG